MSDCVRPHRRQPTKLPRPWDSPCKNTGVGCHFLFQFMKVKSEGEVTQSSPTLSDSMDCSPPGSSVHGILQARVLEWGAFALLVDFGAKALAGIHYFYCTIDFFFFFDCFDIALRILSLQGLVSNFTIAAHSFFYSAIT